MIRLVKRIATACCAGLFLAGCAQAAAAVPDGYPDNPLASQPTKTLRVVPPTATAVQFVLQPSSTPLPTATPEPTNAAGYTSALGPDSFPPGFDPLTGRQVDDPSSLERRPLAIKVTNFPRSVRPQWGLSAADQVYEYYLEDLLTRFIGIFYGTDASRVGPVRSGRPFDETVLRMYKGFLVFGYADDAVVKPWMESDIKNFLVVERPGNCPPLCRIGPEDAYNTLFADTAALTDYVNGLGTNNERQDLNGLRFEEYASLGGKAGQTINTRYSLVSYNRWEYDAASGRYLRWQDAADAERGAETYMPLADSLSGEQVAAENVVALIIEHSYYYQSTSTEIFQMNFTGEGTGYAFRDGRAYPILWRRSAADQMVRLYDSSGRPYPLKPGNVFFQVLGTSSSIEEDGRGVWRFYFDIP